MISTVSQVKKTPPEVLKTPLQARVYQTLAELHISFERVDTEEAITMEDCMAIDDKLQVKTVKTLFLCNRQQTAFYLLVTRGDKPFRSKDFSAALGIPRVSFAPAALLETMLGTQIGATTIYSVLLDPNGRVQVVLDQEVLDEEFYGCSDGTTTSYMKVRTQDIYRKFLPFARHTPTAIEV